MSGSIWCKVTKDKTVQKESFSNLLNTFFSFIFFLFFFFSCRDKISVFIFSLYGKPYLSSLPLSMYEIPKLECSRTSICKNVHKLLQASVRRLVAISMMGIVFYCHQKTHIGASLAYEWNFLLR